MSVKNYIHQAFIATVREVCAEQGLPCSVRPTRNGYLMQVGHATLTWHRSRTPWERRNFRRLHLDTDLIGMQP